MTISGRKKPLDFNTLGERVEMNYQNMLFRLNVEQKMMNKLRPTIVESPCLMRHQKNIVKECLRDIAYRANQYLLDYMNENLPS